MFKPQSPSSNSLSSDGQSNTTKNSNLAQYQASFDDMWSWKAMFSTPSLKFLAGQFIGWAIATIIGMCYTVFIQERQAYNRGWADIWYGYGAFGFGIGVAFAWMGFQGARNPEKKALSLCLFGVNLISFCSYMLIMLRLTPTVEGRFSNPVEPARYLEWIATCPVLILLISEITLYSHNPFIVILNDYFVVGFGFLGAITPALPWGNLFNIAACSAFSFVVYSLWLCFTAAIDGDTETKMDKQSLRWLRLSTITTWSLFPVFWFLYESGIVSFTICEAAFSMIDIGAKVFLTLVLVNTTVEQAQNQKVDEITAIAEELENQVNNCDAILHKMMPEGYASCVVDLFQFTS
jgi:bacteriorhodopsin